MDPSVSNYAKFNAQKLEVPRGQAVEDDKSNRLLRAAGALALIVGTSIMSVANEDAAYGQAFANNYPYMNAQLYDSSSYEWWVDENGDGLKQVRAGTNDELSSPRGFDYRNCTDGAAHYADEFLNIDIPWQWGNANNWDNAASASGYPVKGGSSNSVEPGDIAQSDDGGWGHVGFVTDVKKDSSGNVVEVKIAELNKSGDGNFTHNPYSNKNSSGKFTRWGSNDWDHFIDLNGLNKGLGNTTTFPIDKPQTDTDNNGAADFVITARRDDQYADVRTGLSTWQGFMEPNVWRPLDGYGYDGITPLVGDVTGDNKADYVFVTNDYSNGVKAFVAKSNGSGFDTPKLWWNGAGYSYDGIKVSLADMDNNNADDLVITALRADTYADVRVSLSTWEGFMQPDVWRTLDGYGWEGITPLTGDVTGDKRADYVFITNEHAGGVKAFVSKSSGSSLDNPTQWWNGSGYSYDSIKVALGDVDNNGADDLIFAARRDDRYADVRAALSTWQGFMEPTTWRPLDGYGYDGIQVLSGDVTGDKRSDLVFMTNEHASGVKVFVSESTGSNFKTPSLWWNGVGYGYGGVKINLD